MSTNEHIIIKDGEGNQFLRIDIDGPFRPEQKHRVSITPDQPADLNLPTSVDLQFEASFDLAEVDVTPLAVLSSVIIADPSRLLELINELSERFSLPKSKKKNPKTSVPSNPPHGIVRREPETEECEEKIALLVTGDCSWWPGEGVILAEAEKDMKNRGYAIQKMTHPTKAQFETALANPCVKALVVIGHGSAGDSTKGTENAALCSINLKGEIIQPVDFRILGVPKVPLELFILHSCYQGCAVNKAAWVRSSVTKAADFHGWDSKLRPVQGMIWQKFFK